MPAFYPMRWGIKARNRCKPAPDSRAMSELAGTTACPPPLDAHQTGHGAWPLLIPRLRFGLVSGGLRQKRPLDEFGIDHAFDECGMAEDALVEGGGGFDAFDPQFA